MSGNPFRLGRTRSSSVASYSTQDPKHPQIQKHQQDQANGHRRSHSHRPRRHRHSHRVKPDSIDKLDNLYGGIYHHEGPFDAASRERNRSSKYSPIDALKNSNEEALKATPRERIIDSLTKHRPLDGVAYYPPGTADWTGHTYDYEEGNNMMTEDRGNFRRWPGEVRHARLQLVVSKVELMSIRNSVTRTSRTTRIIND